ncbi:transposable element Tcb2 transposase [Trichonephila clavipes]|nr:transposable element Tcb2 transposase [Trichonephila clavipes]
MVWGAIEYTSRSPLVYIDGTLNSSRSISGVLHPLALHFIRALWNPTFQQDDTRPHVTCIVQTFLEAWRVVGSLEGGQTQAEVAQAIGVSQSVISRIWNRFLETESAGRRPGQGRRRATTPDEDRYLVLTARRHRNMNATLLQQHFRLATGTMVSTQTVRNRLHGEGLYARRPMVCVRLTSRHRRDRREWATEHVNWRRNEWSNVLFSDESRFSVYPDNRRIFIWRDRGNLYIIRDGPLTARRYRDEILRHIVVPYAAAIGDDFFLMDDNCRPHRANLVEDFLFEEGIEDEFLAAPPPTFQELERALLEEWDRIPQLVINSIIDSMPQRCSTLLAFRGNHTLY